MPKIVKCVLYKIIKFIITSFDIKLIYRNKSERKLVMYNNKIICLLQTWTGRNSLLFWKGQASPSPTCLCSGSSAMCGWLMPSSFSEITRDDHLSRANFKFPSLVFEFSPQELSFSVTLSRRVFSVALGFHLSPLSLPSFPSPPQYGIQISA